MQLGLFFSPRTLARVVLVVACVFTAACSFLLPHRKDAIEQQNPSHNGQEFKVLAVIAGDDSRAGLRMSTLVRRQLNEGGWQGVQRSGRWGTENDAMADICPEGMASTVDGVVFVYYNQLSLFACRSRTLAYQVEGGEVLGIEGMSQRLMAYLKTAPGQVIAPPPTKKSGGR